MLRQQIKECVKLPCEPFGGTDIGYQAISGPASALSWMSTMLLLMILSSPAPVAVKSNTPQIVAVGTIIGYGARASKCDGATGLEAHPRRSS